VGHSMGARTVLYGADHPAVRAVVLLAPWIEPGDGPATLPGLAGRRLLVIHGRQDRMTDPGVSARYAEAAAGVASSCSYVAVAADAHAMLRRARLWHELATGFVLAVMCGRSPTGTRTGNTTKEKTTEASTVLAGALAGQLSLAV
jgi:pimeloyl-ACP methyl ester carboxylesterase